MLSALRPRAGAGVERATLTLCVVLLSAAAWVSLGLSAGDGFFSYHHLNHQPVASASFLLFFVANWVVMTVAMMLPTSLPVVATLHSFAGQRSDRWLLVTLAILGYLLVWAAFGALAYLGYLGWQWLLGGMPWLAQHAPIGAPALLLLAGAFQFSSLKYKCLEKCRSPFSFVMQYWVGHGERRHAFRLGMDHGIFCVGCCWALMLLMFAVGIGRLVWMFVLALLMTIEKNVSWGRRLSAPVGVALLVWGAVLLVRF